MPVMVGLDDEKITLVSGSLDRRMAGRPYAVIDLGAGEFVIEAEDDSIPFVPDDPSSFALGIHRDTETPAAAAEIARRSTGGQGGATAEAGHHGRLLGARRDHRGPRHLGDSFRSSIAGFQLGSSIQPPTRSRSIRSPRVTDRAHRRAAAHEHVEVNRPDRQCSACDSSAHR